MKNIDEKILMVEEIKQLQNKRKKLISQQKQEERKKRDRRLYEKGAVFESIIKESISFSKDDYSQLLIYAKSLNGFIQKVSELSKKATEKPMSEEVKTEETKSEG